MNPRTPIPYLLGSLFLLLTTFLLFKSTTEKSNAGPHDEIFVIPSERGQRTTGNEFSVLEEQADRKLTHDEKIAFGRDAGKSWRTFENEWIQFEIPDHPLIQIEVVKPEDSARIDIVGGAVGTTDNRFHTSYRITVGDDRLPYGILLLSDADWLDEGICLCGAIALKRLIVRDGTLMEFSLLDSGQIKKAQVLTSEGKRAILFEWTHSVIPPEIYAHIANSLQIKTKAPWTRSQWIEQSRKYREDLQLIGWISPGDTVEDIREILGPPTETTRNALTYVRSERSDFGDGWEATYRIPMDHGKFTRFEKNWVNGKELEPIVGSTKWALAISDSESVTDEQAKAVFEAFLSTAPETESSVWNQWCQSIFELAEQEIRDERVIPAIENRFTDPDLLSHYAAWVLHRYKKPSSRQLIVERIELSLSHEGEPSSVLDDIWNLFSFLGSDHPEFDRLVRRAVNHADPGFQADGIRYACRLPEKEARMIALEKSQSTDRHVRSMTESLYRKIGTTSDLPELREWKDRETDERLRKEIGELIATLKE